MKSQFLSGLIGAIALVGATFSAPLFAEGKIVQCVPRIAAEPVNVILNFRGDDLSVPSSISVGYLRMSLFESSTVELALIGVGGEGQPFVNTLWTGISDTGSVELRLPEQGPEGIDPTKGFVAFFTTKLQDSQRSFDNLELICRL